MTADPFEEPGLFDIERPPPVSLADRFLFPPLSVLDRRQGVWQDRRRSWLSLGIESEVGRGGEGDAEGERGSLTFSPGRSFNDGKEVDDFTRRLLEMGGTSVFDPVICELAYRWYSRYDSLCLDPFAGGSVRGVAASILKRRYVGIELRPEQVAANQAQAHLGGGDPLPVWVEGDAADLDRHVGDEPFDLLFSCPPYGDLERYSDDPRDLSTMPWPAFVAAYRSIIAASVARLRDDRFAVWVVGNIRDPKGHLRDLVGESVRAFEDAGAHYYNEAIIVDPVGTAALRASVQFDATRKIARTHQQVLVFVKGDPKAATLWVTAD